MPAEIVRKHRDKIVQLCRRYGVARLDIIGSAASETTFDPTRSDIDLLVEFEGSEGLFRRYFDLKEALEQLFHRPVDLLVRRAIRNPYFLQEVERQRVTLYEQSSEGSVE